MNPRLPDPWDRPCQCAADKKHVIEIYKKIPFTKRNGKFYFHYHKEFIRCRYCRAHTAREVFLFSDETYKESVEKQKKEIEKMETKNATQVCLTDEKQKPNLGGFRGVSEKVDINVDKYIGREAVIESVVYEPVWMRERVDENRNIEPAHWAAYVLIKTGIVDTVGTVELRASARFWLRIDRDGGLSCGPESDASKALAAYRGQYGVYTFDEMMGKTVKVFPGKANKDGKRYLTF